MHPNKFSKFVINYLDKDHKRVYSYNAYDDEKDNVLSIKVDAEFGVALPGQIEGTCGGNFTTDHYQEITEEQFWIVFKSYTIQLFQYYQDQVSALETV